MDPRAFASDHLRLLQLERAAEIAEAERLLRTRSDAELQARGVSIARLEVVDLEPGFGGRLHAVLRPSRGGSWSSSSTSKVPRRSSGPALEPSMFA